jgi:dimethylargininase
MEPRLAFTRAVPDTFTDAVVQGDRPVIDVERARRQHREYEQVLREHGFTVTTLPADPAHPDCPFIEDTAVVIDDLAVITRPGAPGRRGEIGEVAAVLRDHLHIEELADPATLDGGDVLQIGDTIYVGRSTRTNDDGIAQLASIAADRGRTTVPVDVTGVLHLKSAVSHLGNTTILIAPGCVDRAVFADFAVIEKAPGEEHLASTLRPRSRSILMTKAAPLTTQRVRHAGFDVTTIDVSEFQAADGGLTCLSVLVPADR